MFFKRFKEPEKKPTKKKVRPVENTNSVITSIVDYMPSMPRKYLKFRRAESKGAYVTYTSIVIEPNYLDVQGTLVSQGGSPSEMIPYQLQGYQLCEMTSTTPTWEPVESQILTSIDKYSLRMILGNATERDNHESGLGKIKATPTVDMKDLRCITKCLFYDKIREMNKRERTNESKVFLLKDDIEWMNRTGYFTSDIKWTQDESERNIVERQYPKWYESMSGPGDYVSTREISQGNEVIRPLYNVIRQIDPETYDTKEEYVSLVTFLLDTMNYSKSYVDWKLRLHPYGYKPEGSDEYQNWNDLYYFKDTRKTVRQELEEKGTLYSTKNRELICVYKKVEGEKYSLQLSTATPTAS